MQLEGVRLGRIGHLAGHGHADGHGVIHRNRDVLRLDLDPRFAGDAEIVEGNEGPAPKGRKRGKAPKDQGDELSDDQDAGDAAEPGRALAADGLLQVGVGEIVGRPLADGA